MIGEPGVLNEAALTVCLETSWNSFASLSNVISVEQPERGMKYLTNKAPNVCLGLSLLSQLTYIYQIKRKTSVPGADLPYSTITGSSTCYCRRAIRYRNFASGDHAVLLLLSTIQQQSSSQFNSSQLVACYLQLWPCASSLCWVSLVQQNRTITADF